MDKVNDYDKFAAMRQKDLQKGVKLPHKYIEKPMMKSLLPSLKDMRVLMLGCGSGEESVILKESEASKLIGIDLSEESIRIAKETYPDSEFKVGDMHKIEFDDNYFDFVYSSLAIHYSGDPKIVYDEVFRVLRPGGRFLFSIAHPIRWASQQVEIDGISMRLTGFSKDDKNPRLYGKYLSFAEHEETFPSGEVLRFWVGSPSLHFGFLKDSGFRVENFVESKVIDECKDINPSYYERYKEFPQFMAFLVVK